MVFVLKFFKTVRTHWKKSIVFTGIGIYGLKFAKGRYEDDMLRRQYCAEAKVYGEQISELGGQNRKITVFLNPAACGTESKKLFEKNAAPVLYLAGLEVNVVKTEYEGQIKEFFKYLERKHVDGVVVAGGNGSLVEMITGMMRKEDQEFRQKVPVGVIPTGKTNQFATFFFGSEKQKVKRMLDSAMAIVKGVTQKIDVLKIEGDDGRSTFALCGLEAGAYRDAREKTSKYWYVGPLKHRFTYMWKTMSTWPPCIRGTLEYMEAKDTDVPKSKVKKAGQPEKHAQSWTSWLLYMIVGPRKPALAKDKEEEEEEAEFENEELVKKDLSTVELTLSSNYHRTDQTMRAVQLGLGPEDVTKTHFISEGWRRINVPDWSVGSESNELMLCRKVKFTPDVKEGSELWYTIDGEKFEAMPIEVTLLKNRLRIFTTEDKSPS